MCWPSLWICTQKELWCKTDGAMTNCRIGCSHMEHKMTNTRDSLSNKSVELSKIQQSFTWNLVDLSDNNH